MRERRVRCCGYRELYHIANERARERDTRSSERAAVRECYIEISLKRERERLTRLVNKILLSLSIPLNCVCVCESVFQCISVYIQYIPIYTRYIL